VRITPIPEPLRGEERHTFANHTVVVRLPDIARRVLAENELHPGAIQAIQSLIQDIPSGFVRLLKDHHAPDSQAWDGYLASELGKNWLQIPWFTTEAYFYRRILEATGYFEPGPGYEVDPFTLQKQAGTASNLEAVRGLSETANQHSHAGRWDEDFFTSFLLKDLWGNQADLSLWPADKKNKPDHQDLAQAQAYLLVDDARACADYLSGLDKPAERADILADNAGFELTGDLALADYLLTCGIVRTVRFHLKAYPTFVSDAMAKDMRQSIDFLATSSSTAIHHFGKRLSNHLEQGRLQLNENDFWNSPLAMWELPAGLRAELSSASLVICKGDANYRRLLGDRHWPFTTPIAQIVSYFPCPLLLLRTLKSEVAAGLPAGRPEETARQDPTWMTDGRWGVIQFWEGD
jgi:uncharacterized protein with ATP-grasp and redox domains